ncbi:MAG: S-methyl-5-thioribose-1-phosphate isomerase [Eggerthellaceae bacterium]|nr:S-methyl-5-thioribose-1-phosphate isomerase [Eggerthellaceae bacterium]
MVPNLENLPRTIVVERRDAVPVVRMIDQRLLPYEEAYLETSDWRMVVDAIKTLAVRGAPAIGVAGAAAVMLSAYEAADFDDFSQRLSAAAAEIEHARPTAVNLAWAVRRAMELAADMARDGGEEPAAIAEALFALCEEMIREDEAVNRAIGRYGAALLPDNCAVLTHCNAGSLATAFYGTALGVVYAAFEQGKLRRVYSDETRPVGQGARLTVWELSRAGVPVTLICDDMAASVMAAGKVDAVVVGADRIAANGDTANKIGTLGVAVLARHFGIPFYVAAPRSTIDLSLADGAGIVIEQRSAAEVLPRPIPGVDVENPAFDVTPAHLISAIITEVGVFAPNDLEKELWK